MILSLALASAVVTQSSAETEKQNERFEALKATIFSAPYETLPTYNVNRKLFGKSGKSDLNKLRQAANRTFTDERDLIEFPEGQKLLQANGICFAGTWKINEQSNFAGLFAANTISPVIARTSVFFNGTLQKNKRAVGMAIKLLPDDLSDRASLNAFVMHTMGGVVTQHTLDLKMDNEPPLGRLPRWKDLTSALRIKRDFERADRESSGSKAKINFRPVTQLSNYQVNKAQQNDNAVIAKWMRLSPANQQRVDADDFRDELDVARYKNHELIYQLDVAADHGGKKSTAVWQTIGQLRFTESITSAACDQQLHFQHPILSQN